MVLFYSFTFFFFFYYSVIINILFVAIDKNLNLYSQRYKLSPSSIDEQGLPRYDSGSLFDFLYSPDSLNWNDYFDSWEHSNYPSSTPSTSEDASYAALSFGPSGDTAFWDRSSVARIIKVCYYNINNINKMNTIIC